MKRLFYGLFMLAVLPLYGAVAEEYPNRLIKVILTLPPGSATDTLARTVTLRMQEKLGQSIIIENRVGADGEIGMRALLACPPDGYCFSFANNGHILYAPALREANGEKAYLELTKDLTLIGATGQDRFGLFVRSSLNITTLKELRAYVAHSSEPLKVGTGNPLSVVSARLFNATEGKGRMIEVTYRGEPMLMQDLIAGRIDAAFLTFFSGVPQLETGALRAIGVLGTERSVYLPNTPTLESQGAPIFARLSSLLTVVTNAGVPQERVDVLKKALEETLAEPDIVAALRRMRVEPVTVVPEVAWAAASTNRVEIVRLLKEGAAFAKVKSAPPK